MLNEEKKFRLIVRRIIRESDDRTILAEKTMHDAFIKPFQDVFKVAKVALKDVLTVAKFNWDMLVTFDPIKIANLKNNFKERRKLIKEEYREVMEPIKAALGPDVKLAAFMLNPVGFLGAAALKSGYDNAPDVVDFFREAGFGATVIGTAGKPTDREKERSGGKIKEPVGVIGTAMKALRKLFFIEESKVLPYGVVLLREKTKDEDSKKGTFNIQDATAQALDDLGVLDMAKEATSKIVDDAKEANEEFVAVFESNMGIADSLADVQTYEQLKDILDDAKSKELDIAQSIEGLDDQISGEADKILRDKTSREGLIRAIAAKNGKDIPKDEPIPEEFLNAPDDKLKEEAVAVMFIESTESLRQKAGEIKQEISKAFLEAYEPFRDEFFEDYGIDGTTLKYVEQTPAGKEFLSIFEDTLNKLK